ncbi:hypothetical protein OSTOST_20037, partial [Ostertagia ostertagi]
YFVKSEVHSPFSLKNRFSIVDSRCITRGEDVIFLRRKPPPRRSLKEYKYENFVKPGLVQKGHYPGVKLEIKRSPSSSDLPFNGTLKRSPTAEEPRQNVVTPDVNADVCDEWLTTYGGFRALPEEGQNALENGNTTEVLSPREPTPKRHSSVAVSENGSIAPDSMDDSFNDDVYYPDDSGDSCKKDRFKDIRPDEFKALGIDVKSIVPKKDFYAMTREERAAAVAAEFEAIDALGPKKEDGYLITTVGFSCRVNPYHLNTAKMKRVMKSILSNPLLAYDKVLYTRRALLARRRAAERHKILRAGPEVYFKKLDRTLDSSLGPIAEKILEEHNPMDITAIGNSDAPCTIYSLLGEFYLSAITQILLMYSKLLLIAIWTTWVKPTRQLKIVMIQPALVWKKVCDDLQQKSVKRISKFKCLPRRMGNSGKYVNVANALAVTLYMCNENTLTLLQERDDSADKNMSVNEGEPWMGNFIITNAPDLPSLLGQDPGTRAICNAIEGADNSVDNNRIFS